MMYFALAHDMGYWTSALTDTAIPVNPIPPYTPHWWNCEPITPPLPPLTFAVVASACRSDIYLVPKTCIELYSARLIKLLNDADIAYETFPTTLIDRESGKTLEFAYETFHLLEKYPLDKIRTRNAEGKVVSQAVPKKMFRIEKYGNLLIIHRDLKAVFDEAGITGFTYRPFK